MSGKGKTMKGPKNKHATARKTMSQKRKAREAKAKLFEQEVEIFYRDLSNIIEENKRDENEHPVEYLQKVIRLLNSLVKKYDLESERPEPNEKLIEEIEYFIDMFTEGIDATINTSVAPVVAKYKHRVQTAQPHANNAMNNILSKMVGMKM